MSLSVKICGLSNTETLDVAAGCGAAIAGFVHYPASPRHVEIDGLKRLIRHAPSSVKTAVLLVDPDNALIDSITNTCRPTYLQLHGRESPERVAEIRKKFGIPLIKALPVAAKEDLAVAQGYARHSDMILFDAKPLPQDTRPGGNARSFNWEVLRGNDFPFPWMLAGGLTAQNLKEAVAISGARVVDVSSGVEDAPGVKSPEKIRAFLEVAKSL